MLAVTALLLLQSVDQALAGVVVPSGAGTLTIGPQAMEGNLQIHPGDTIKAGYDFTMPGAHAAAQVTVDNASITMAVACANGTTPPPIVFALPVQTYSDTAGSSSWYPSGDQSTAAVYQGSVIAPNLCAGGVMSDANGATFKATIFATDTTDKQNFRFHYSDNTSGSWSATVTASPTATAKTVLTATLTPSLGLTLVVDKSSAIPGDILTYSGTVTNTGATLSIGGDFTASATAASTATVKSYWDDIATSLDTSTWTALAGTAAAQSAYTPAVAPPISSGMTLTATPVSASGVTYPTSGDSLLGTTMTSGSSALWHYSATVALTPSQVTTLLDPTKVKAVRNSFHLEVSPANANITQPSIINVDFSGIFFAASPAPSGAVTNISIAVQPPTGSAINITSATVPALSSLATGASASYSTTYKVLVPAAKGTTEADSAYQSRLANVEGTSLTATASASGSSTGGVVSASAPAVSAAEHLPILSIAKSGPSVATAGTTATYPLTLKDTGGAAASGMTLADSVPSGATGTVSGVPATLSPGASSSGVQATFAIPASQTPGNLTDTATVSWQDANGNSYGPVSSLFTTVVQNPLLGARLTFGLAAGDAGLMPINGSQGLQVNLVNSSGAPIPNQTVTISATGANPTSFTVVTDSNGNASASYTGQASGVDQLQATASSASTTISSNTVSVTWINPIEPVATTPVQGNFFGEDPSQTSFVAKPGDTAAFQESFPTINFNPPANTVPHNVAGVGPTTTPITDVTTDAVGNFAGTIAAQGNGAQAGVGSLSSFDASLTANFVVSQPQDVTFKIFADEGFVMGVGGGATRDSGPLVNEPTSGLTPFNSYPVLASYNTSGATAPATYTLQLHFPTAGAYPYELDFFACCNAQMSLAMTVVSVNAGPYNLFTGYGDSVRPAGNSTFPSPWNGSSNTTFVGSGAPYDTGALRFDNNTNQPITLGHVTVDIGTHHYDPWSQNVSLAASSSLILAGAGSSFDTSEAVGTKAGSGGGSSGFAASPFATNFLTCCGGIGPVGVAFDSSGNLLVRNYATGILYKFGPNGGAAGPDTQVNATPIGGGGPAGLAFSKDGKHLYEAVQGTAGVFELDQSTGAVIRTVASGIGNATGLATDPISGDLFVTQGGGSNVYRISNPTSATPALSIYINRGADGIAFGPDGTMYLASGGVAIVAGTNASSPGSLITVIQSSALAGIDGIALLPPPPGDTGESIAVNSNFGVIVEIDNPLTANPIFHNIVTGGSRGDFATVGPDGCLYATQTSSVEKVTASDGSCPFVPSICLPNSTVPQVHVTVNGATFNYNDPGLALTNGGIDGECNGSNESQAWQEIDQGKAGPVNIPLPPSVTLALQAAPSTGHIVGQTQAFTVAAMNGAGNTVPNVSVQLGVTGANPQQLSGTTDSNGTATFSYSTTNAGTDTIEATAFVSGVRSVSNAVSIQWTIPAPGGPTPGTSGPAPPSVVITAPIDGSAISVPTAVTATVAPPASSPLASWNVTYQNVSGGSPTTLASGSGGPPTTLATLDPTSLAAGTYAISVNASTNAGGGASAVTRVIVGGAAGAGTAAQGPPVISLPSPADGSVVTKPVPVTATISPPSGQTIASWSVSYQAQDLQPAVTIASGTGTPPAPLATFDPTLLPNDTYAINVSATASGGGTQTVTTTVAVFGNLKLGRYVTTFQDLSVPVNGFQMEVRRVYDSIDKRVGDFGIGWHVDLANFRVSENRQLGAGGWTEYPTQCIFGLCFYGFKTSSPHYVTVTFPDQHQEIFDFTPQGGAGILYWQGGAAFTPRAGTGTTSTLEVAGDTGVSYDFAGNLTGANGGYYNPTRFKLTTHDGRVLILDTVLGLLSETDRNGNSLSIDSSGVHASNGQSIVYTRDSTGRITQITGPSNQTLTYSYSASGDLASSSDPDNNTATYAYDANHRLLTVNGPGQTRPLNTLNYDSSGRLTSVTDGNGNTTRINSNVAGQQQTVTDATGKLTTVYTLDALGDILRQDQVFDGRTLTSTATYDAVGRPLSRIDPVGHTWTGAYDANGNLLNLATPQSHAVGLSYDSFGAPLSFTDPLGKTTNYSYDANGNLTTFTNALGQPDTYGYDAQGHATSHTDGLGKTWSYTFDAAGHQTSMTDPLGNVTRYGYDSSGNLTSTTDPTGAVTAYAYDAAGNLTSTKDALGQVTALTYDALGRLATRTDAGGNKTTYGYDGTNALNSVTDPLGRITKYTYDADGRLATVTDPAGGVTTYAYDGSGRLASEKDPIGRVTSYSYDDAGRLTSKTMPNGGVYRYAYNADGYQTTVTDPLGHATGITYDSGGHVTSTTDALGNVTTFTLDALGRVTKTVDPLGNSSSQGYDAAGHLIASTDALGNTTTYGYDAAGNRTSLTDPLGHATSYGYDAAGRLAKTTDALGRSTSFAYDALGRLTATTLPSGISTIYGYDPLGHEISVKDALGNTSQYSYDAAGQRIAATDPRGNSTGYGYDLAGRLTTISDALGGKVTIGFDAAGQQTSIVNPRGDTTGFTYDPLGNVATQTNPAGKVTTMSYDAAGHLLTKVDARGISVSYGYDAAGNQTSTTFPGGTIAQAYDALGRRTSMTDPTGTTSFSYDAASNVRAVAAPQGTVSYTYDAAGRRSAMTLPGPRSVAYSYDAANELTGLTDWFNQTTYISYTQDGLQSVMSRPAGIKTTYGYDNADRLTAVNNDGPNGPLRDFSYTLDAAGNRTSVTYAAGTESYTLDALNRLTQVSYPNGDKVSYTYDAAGNRLSETVNGTTTNYGYNSAGQLITVGATTYAYDAEGNLISAGANSFAWDWAGRLSQATVSGTTSSYTYDGDGLRVGSQTGSTNTSYLWDRQSALPVLADDGSNSYIQTSNAGLLEQLNNGGTSSAIYPLSDALGSIRGIANSAGALAGSAAYDVFGALRTNASSTGVFGFDGQQTDPNGLIYLRARYLGVDAGRFLSPDPVFPNANGTQGYGLYVYATNNPTTVLDPSGQQPMVERTSIQTAENAFVQWAERVGARYLFRKWLQRQLLLLLIGLGAGATLAATAEISNPTTAGEPNPPSTPDTAPSPVTSPAPEPVTTPTPSSSPPETVLVYRLLDGNNSTLPSKPNTQRSQFNFNPTMSTFEVWALGGNRQAPTKPYMLQLSILVPTPARTAGNTGPVLEVPGCKGTYEPPPDGHWGVSCATTDPAGTIQSYARSGTGVILRDPVYAGQYATGAP